MLHKNGAHITAIEGNAQAYLRCLCTKEIFSLTNARYLLGNFNKFLQESKKKYDIVFASGILYHMTNPISTLKLIESATDNIFLWTHYYDERIISQRSDSHLFRKSENFEELGGYLGMHKTYPQQAIDWAGFTGGQESHAIWLYKESIVKFLIDYGYDVTIGFDELDHPNGPSFALCAQR